MNTDKPKLAVLTLTSKAQTQALRLRSLLPCDCYTSDKLVTKEFIGFGGSMADCVKRLFEQYDALLFICATGITVRMIAPLVVDKLADPAVLVMDEQANHVISLLSGHVGGGNQLTTQIASLLGADPVVTTATDVNQLTALDTLIQSVGANVAEHRQAVKNVNFMLVNGQKVGLYLDEVTVNDTRGFVLLHDLNTLPESLDYLIIVSARTNIQVQSICPVIQIIPKNIVVGMGCKRGTDGELLYQSLVDHLKANHLDLRAVGRIGSVVIKQDEQGLCELGKRLNVPFDVFEIETLREYEHLFPVSEFVRKTIGIGSVSQPSAWVMSGGNLLGETIKQDGLTITLGVNQCCI